MLLIQFMPKSFNSVLKSHFLIQFNHKNIFITFNAKYLNSILNHIFE